jgi:hypothetical protein
MVTSLTSLISQVMLRTYRLLDPTLDRRDCGQGMGSRGRHSRSAPIPPRSGHEDTCIRYIIDVTVCGLIDPKGESVMAESIKARRELTRKEGKCQMCEESVPLEKQFTVTNDLEAGTVKVRKNAARNGAEVASHYCEGCKDRRVRQKQAWLDARAKRMVKASA